MKTLITAFLIFVLAIPFTGCDTKGKNDSVKEYALQMRLAKGDKFAYNINMDMEMDLMNMKMRMEMGSEFDVIDSIAGGKVLKITTKKMNTNMDMGGMGSQIDSVLNQTNNKMIGKSVIITLEGTKVIDVKGMDELIANTDDTSSQETMKKMFSKENINSMYGMLFGLYPNKPVKVGESWTADNNMDMGGMLMSLNTKYTLTDVKDNIAEIALEGKIDSKGKMKQGDKEIEMDMDGTQKGKMFVKLSDGYLKNGNYDLNIDAKINMMGSQMPIKMKMVCTMTGN